ncbi:MAG: hypothetical protein IJ647_04365 [Prevotella sp.]|nr:hypothetical protein [Prevotella sp.]
MEDVFVVRIHSLIPLERIRREYRRRYRQKVNSIAPPEHITHAKSFYGYIGLSEFKQRFSYRYSIDDKDVTRIVELRVYLLYSTEKEYPHKRRCYLVIGTDIDKVFGHEEQNRLFKHKDLCTKHDMLHLKKAFYNKFYYHDGDKVTSYYEWQDRILKKVTGKEYHGKYGRHYIMDVLTNQIDVSTNRWIDLETNFSNAYYNQPVDEAELILKEHQTLAYGLLYGNDNCERTNPNDIEEALQDGYSNNRTEITYAGNSTLLFLHTHHPYSWKKEHLNKIKKLNAEFNSILNLPEICIVMDAKQRLREIMNLMKKENASRIKEVLSDISEYLGKNPLRLSEMGLKMKYLYKTLEIDSAYATVLQMGELSSEAINIKQTGRLNKWVACLTAATVVLGFFQLFPNNKPLNTIMNMNPCNCNSIAIPLDCYMVVCVLLLLVLIALIVLVVLNFVRYRQRDDIKKIIRELDEKGEI